MAQTSQGDTKRLRKFLYYVMSLIYNRRKSKEHNALFEVVEEATDSLPKGTVKKMHKTIADVIEEKGFKKGAVQTQREVLVDQLHIRFKNVKKTTMDRIVEEIKATNDNNQLTTWIKEFALANAITDMSFRCLTQN